MLLAVRLLFAISVLCFCTVLWIALSLARRLRIAQSKEAKRVEQGTATEFFEAGEFRTPRPLPMKQQIRPKALRPWKQSVNEVHAAHDNAASLPGPAGAQPARAIEPIAARQNSGLQLVAAAPPKPMSTSWEALEQDTVRRKSPQPARASGFRRVDLSHYTEDMGDLTDPYTYPLRSSGTQGPHSKNS